MKKGISPLIASVLLIAITIAIAAVLANWVTGYTRDTLRSTPNCIGGSVNFISLEYPKWDDQTFVLSAIIEAQYTDLTDFAFEVVLDNDEILIIPDETELYLEAGKTGLAKTGTIPEISADFSNVKQIRVTTSCDNVRTEWVVIG